MNKYILTLAVIAATVMAARAYNIVVCRSSCPCGGACYVLIGGNEPTKFGDCVDASDPFVNWEQYPCDCKIC